MKTLVIQNMTKFTDIHTLYEDLVSYADMEKRRIGENNDEKLFAVKSGFLYFIVTENKSKIGITSNLQERIKVHMKYVHDEFLYLFVSPICSNFNGLETDFKNNFSLFSINGSEWYENSHIDDYVNFLNLNLYNNPDIEHIDNNNECFDQIGRLYLQLMDAKNECEIYKKFFYRMVYLFDQTQLPFLNMLRDKSCENVPDISDIISKFFMTSAVAQKDLLSMFEFIDTFNNDKKEKDFDDRIRDIDVIDFKEIDEAYKSYLKGGEV